MIPQNAIRGRKRKQVGDREGEPGVLDFLNAWKKKLEDAPPEADDAPDSPSAEERNGKTSKGDLASTKVQLDTGAEVYWHEAGTQMDVDYLDWVEKDGHKVPSEESLEDLSEALRKDISDFKSLEWAGKDGFLLKLDSNNHEASIPSTISDIRVHWSSPTVTTAQPVAAQSADDDEEAHLCDLHFIANCQSCQSWDTHLGGEQDGDPEDDDRGWLSHALSFEKDRLGKDLTWKRKNEELSVIDPREKEKTLKEEKKAKRGEGSAWRGGTARR